MTKRYEMVQEEKERVSWIAEKFCTEGLRT